MPPKKKRKRTKKKYGHALFNFRLSREAADTLKDVATKYGSPSASAFAREVITVMCTGTLEEINAVSSKLQTRLAEASLANMAAIANPQKPTAKAVSKAKEGKSRG